MIKDDFCLGYMPDGTGTAFPFDDVFKYSKNILKEGMEDVDAIVLWGGEDIAPSYYKEKRHSRNQSYTGHPSQRDKNEWKAMLYAKANGIPIIGVCRGAQFLCIFSGGKLIHKITSLKLRDKKSLKLDFTFYTSIKNRRRKARHYGRAILIGFYYSKLWLPDSLYNSLGLL